MTVVLCWNFVP